MASFFTVGLNLLLLFGEGDAILLGLSLGTDPDVGRRAGHNLYPSPLGRETSSKYQVAVYVDTVEEKAIVALRPKPAFQALFQIATTREGSRVVFYKENPPDQFPSPEDDLPCSWWRRAREWNCTVHPI